jgi:hypothetical protein
MNNKNLNNLIEIICDDSSEYESFGGKSIPYIGWGWREVNFDSKDYDFGILPYQGYGATIETGFINLQSTPIMKLGFMENNKWDYDYHHCNEKDWKEIKKLLNLVVIYPFHFMLKALDDKIQGLLNE